MYSKKQPWKRAVTLALTTAVFFTIMTPMAVFAYKNGASVKEQWATSTVEYGTGDPFIMKYNGTYYLYPSSLDGQLGIKVWSSANLVDWKYEGLCNSGDDVIKGAYAPEVTYWNGTFYMYTASPGGEQHRVLTSTSPTGPFKRQGDVYSDPDDLIDGSVFIDDDPNATKYFLHSGGSSIEYGIMNRNMLTASGHNKIAAATIMGRWTEGPSIFKRNGKYYMTYTGNHVLADNYMIEYAVGTSMTNWKEPEENRLLINTEEGITGLGHNSTVVGPDLDTRYIVYHSLVSNTNAPERRLNIDRMVFNGDKLEVQGPTWWDVENPKMPEFYDNMANANNWTTVSGSAKTGSNKLTLSGSSELRSKKQTTADYTAEFNLWITSSTSSSKAGGVVSYKDANNYAYAYLQPQSNKVYLDLVVSGKTTSYSANLPSEYANTNNVLRKLTVKKEGNTFDLYVDDRLLISNKTAALSGGYIGLKTENCTAAFGYTAFSSTVNGNQDKDSVKPTGSAMDAVHANSTSKTFSTDKITESGAGLTSYYVKGVTAGNSLTFKIDAQATSYYSAEIRAKSQSGTKVSISVDGKVVASNVSLTASGSFVTDVVRNVKISESAKTVTLTVTAGSADIYSLKLAKGEDIFDTQVSQSQMDFEWLDGNWSESGNTISATNTGVWSTASYGSENWGDYEVEADVNLKSGSDVGLMVRLKYATDASDSKNGIGGCQSPDYHYGYYAFINTSGVHLGKQMFDWKGLKSASKTLSRNKTYHLKVRAEGANIKIWLDNTLVIDYTDTNQPILSGKIGLRAYLSNASYQNLSLKHLNTATPVGKAPTLTSGATAINKNTFQFYSTAEGKGYEIKNGGIDFNNGLNRNVKGVLRADAFLDGTVSADLALPGTGGFGVGLLVRCKRSYFGNGIDDLDGIGVQLERGPNGSIQVKAYEWANKSWKGVIAETSIANYFSNQQAKTAHLSITLDGKAMTVSVDGTKRLTVDVSKWTGDSTRTAIGFRSQNSAHVTMTNFTYQAKGAAQPGGSTTPPAGSTPTPGGHTTQPGGSTVQPGGGTAVPGGSTPGPNDGTRTPDCITQYPGSNTAEPSDSTAQPGDNTDSSGGNAPGWDDNNSTPDCITQWPDGNTSRPSDSTAQPSPDDSNAGTIILIVVIAVVVLAGAGVGIWFFLKKKKQG